MALFGAPVAHEDSPRRAVHAALGIQRALRTYGEELQAQRGLTLQIAYWAQHRLVVVGKIGDDLRMDTPPWRYYQPGSAPAADGRPAACW